MKSNKKQFNARLTIAIDPTTDPAKVTPARIEGYLREVLDVGPRVAPPYSIVSLKVSQAIGGSPRGTRGSRARKGRAGKRR